MLDFSDAADPVDDYLAALRLIEGAAGDVDVLVPGHGSVGGADQVRARIDQDHAYVQALRDAGAPDDPRVGPSATFDWMSGVHERQLQQLARRSGATGRPDRDPLATQDDPAKRPGPAHAGEDAIEASRRECRPWPLSF